MVNNWRNSCNFQTLLESKYTLFVYLTISKRTRAWNFALRSHDLYTKVSPMFLCKNYHNLGPLDRETWQQTYYWHLVQFCQKYFWRWYYLWSLLKYLLNVKDLDSAPVIVTIMKKNEETKTQFIIGFLHFKKGFFYIIQMKEIQRQHLCQSVSCTQQRMCQSAKENIHMKTWNLGTV